MKNEVFDYKDFLKIISNRVLTARVNFSKQANREANALYWFIGKIIVENQEKQGWGEAVVENLSTNLKTSFPDIKLGFSPQNLWYMRQLYLEYRYLPNLQRLVGEIGWGSNLEIMAKVKDIKAREYYLKAVNVDVEYALRDIHKPIGVSGYRLSKELPEDLVDKIPDPKKLQEEILKEIDCNP